MLVAAAHVSLEPGRVLLRPTLVGWLHGGRPTRLKLEHVTGFLLREPRRGRPGRLEIRTRCAAEPFVVRFRRAQWAEVTAVCDELAVRMSPSSL